VIKNVPLSSFYQVFSVLDSDKPSQVWAIQLEGDGIPGLMIDDCVEKSHGWSGWAFEAGPNQESKPYMLFEQEHDAIFAKLIYGEHINVN